MGSNAFTLPTYANYGDLDPYDLYGYQGNGTNGFSPTGSNANSSMNYDTALSQSGQDVNSSDPMQLQYSANRNEINTIGNQLSQEAGNQLNYYGAEQGQYTAAENQALNNLATTPGYTPDQASQININYGQYNTSPDQYAAITGDPNAPVSQLEQGISGEGAMLNQYQSDLGSQLGQYGSELGGATSGYGTGVSGAASGLQSGLQNAQSNFGALNTAVNNPGLAFDPNQTEQQMTNQDVQNLVTSAGTTVGNQFQAAKNQLYQQAAAQGNTSPEALAAEEMALTTQGAATAGDAMTNAQIAANNAQYQRAAGIEQQREGAVQTQTGLQATAATTEEAAAQAAAGQAGQANIAAQENIGGQNIAAANTLGQENVNAVNQYGQFSTGQENTMANQLYGASSTAEQLASNRAAQNAQMQYGQGTGSAQLTSQGAQTVGNAQQAGLAAYRSGVAGQQAAAQQGGENAMGQQQAAYATQTSGNNTSLANQGNFINNKPSAGDTLASGMMNAVAGLFGDGGVADYPQIAKLGEKGPELVVPLDKMAKYKTSRYRSNDMTPKSYGEEAA